MPEQRITASTFDDSQLASSTREVLLQDIDFIAEKVADKSYTELKKKYVPLNSGKSKPANEQEQSSPSKNDDNNSRQHDGIPSPKVIIYPDSNIKLTWNKIKPIGAGLVNLGNTCYLNSVLQCLCYTPPLANYALAEQHKKDCRKIGFCVLCELQSLMVRCLKSNGSSVKPWPIVNKLKNIASHIQFGRQEDAHEFLRYLVDGIQSSCLAAYPKNLDQYSKDTTMIYRIFGGYLRSLVQCAQCKYKSIKYDPMLDLSLDIADLNTLSAMLRKFIEPEILSGRDMYTCSKCKVKVKAMKKFTIHRAPVVLTIPIKRFNKFSLFGGKNSRKIKFTETLDLRPYMTSKTGSPLLYNLYGVLVHSGGSCNSGHYYCYVKSSNNQWYCMNDSHVTKSNINAVLLQEAYILFYISSPTLSSSESEKGMFNNSSSKSNHNQTFSSSPMKHLKKPADRGNYFSRSTFIPVSSKETVPKMNIVLKQNSNSTSDSKSLDCSPKKISSPASQPQTLEHDNIVKLTKRHNVNMQNEKEKASNIGSLKQKKIKQGFVPRQVLSLKPFSPRVITSDAKNFKSREQESKEVSKEVPESNKSNSLDGEKPKITVGSSEKDIEKNQPECNDSGGAGDEPMLHHKTTLKDDQCVDLSISSEPPHNNDDRTKKRFQEEYLTSSKKKKEKKKKKKRNHRHSSDGSDEEEMVRAKKERTSSNDDRRSSHSKKKHKKHHKKHSKKHKKLKEKSSSSRKLIDSHNNTMNSSHNSVNELSIGTYDQSAPRTPNAAPVKMWDDNKANRSHWDGSQGRSEEGRVDRKSRDAYSISVKSWEGDESNLEKYKTGDLKRKRHFLDEEIDRGKIKKIKRIKNRDKYHRDPSGYRSKGFRRM
ncbi:uncharacterized protein TRIADDRAFT_53651 [Trichoplax adhaerens]|uniref:Ubiquitin carboxyl-terminal hydrolase n=1 Tax=Trichoplax adhaerens TaxID=10228 RepID=B3RPT1_TRIAD|nr:hypothetical protein TRIADDRAFT_53651 [Trichoplax adhaerens]EDV28239.1 hypothetical protein TRIADDRAFT_53651 [Trichoplax adhaerens]|eukprot:XP_002110073.1 hypothetical protein TRIADDRAFT_53651 [Trichoplax adhaerens]